MESDSDQFESADEDFDTDDQHTVSIPLQEKNVEHERSRHIEAKSEQIKNVSLVEKQDDTEDNDNRQIRREQNVPTKDDACSKTINEIKEKFDIKDNVRTDESEVTDCVITSMKDSETTGKTDKQNNEIKQCEMSEKKDNETKVMEDSETKEKPKPRVVEKRERPQRTKEAKTKLGSKLGMKLDKPVRFDEPELQINPENTNAVLKNKKKVPETEKNALKTKKDTEKETESSDTKNEIPAPCWEDELDWTRETAVKVAESEKEIPSSCWEDDVDWTPEPAEKVSETKKKSTEIQKKTTEDKNEIQTSSWDDDLDWTPIENDYTISPNLYSEKSNKIEKSYWDNEADYMELPQETTQNQPQKPPETREPSSSSWGNWGTWGVSSLLSTASLGVTTLTNSVSQGITTVLETGIGIPDPEELARIDRQQRPTESQPAEARLEPAIRNSGFGLGNFVSGVTHITKLVESTGTKVLSGGLDTLEVLGKKTMEVLQEGDPGFKRKKALFGIDNDKPVLSQVLREAKEKGEEENKFLEERHFAKKAHYETLFDDHQGLVHLEALEMLSKQCDIKLETLVENLSETSLTDMQETMAQIKELCELPEEEDDNDSMEIETIREKLELAVSELNVRITYEHLLKTWLEVDGWLQDGKEFTDRVVHQKAIETLAKLTAISVEQFHRSGELLLVKERRSTVDEADSLVQLTVTLTSLIGIAAAKFSEKLNFLAENSMNSDGINSLITNIFLEAANSSSYIQNAFQLLIPVLQVGAV